MLPLKLGLPVDCEGAAVALAVFADEALDELGILADALLVAVVAVDEYHEVGGAEGHLGTLVVAGRGPYPTLCVAVDRETGNVEHAAANALVGLTLAAHAEGQRVAHELVGIEAADAIAKGYRSEVHQVYQGVNLVEFLALLHASD